MLLIICIIAGLILAIIPHILWFIGWIGCRIAGVNLPYSHFGIAALIIVILFWIILAYGYFIGRWKVESVALEYTHKDIPEAFDGFKIVHISDLHLSTFDDDPERLNSFVEEINRHKPDLLCFTGDMVTVGRSEAEPYTDILNKISAKYGILSVLGNHDFMIYRFKQSEDREKAVEELVGYQENVLGWNLLRNDSAVIESEDGSKITFIGVDNANFGNQGFPTIHKGDLKMALEGTDGFRILLTHDPSHWRAEVLPETDIPLTLSGHTHSAQIRIFGWTPARWSFNETAGRYDSGNQTLYINVGLGCTAPFRLGVNPEVTVITLKSAGRIMHISEK
jgi:predicted MPP superfamily phosphohydrolase